MAEESGFASKMHTWLLAYFFQSVSRMFLVSMSKVDDCTYSCSRDARQRSKPRRSGQRCHTCSKHDEREKTFLIMCDVLVKKTRLADVPGICEAPIYVPLDRESIHMPCPVKVQPYNPLTGAGNQETTRTTKTWRAHGLSRGLFETPLLAWLQEIPSLNSCRVFGGKKV